jgi:choline monooxygenase
MNLLQKSFGLDCDIPNWLCSISDISTKDNYVVPAHSPNVFITMDENNQAKCLSNICTHKQSLMYNGRGKAGSVIVCPIHKWTWNKNGCIKGARGFEISSQMDLPVWPTYNWNGHVFSGDNSWLSDIDKLGSLSKWLDVSNYVFEARHTMEYDFSWQIFMEIFLDLYHVQSFHPGLRSLTDCKKFNWVFGNNWICQTGRFNKEWPLEPNYAALYSAYKNIGYYDSAEYGAVWLGIYPNIMIEYYPGSIVVSTIWPNGANKCINHLEFYYDKTALEKLPEFPHLLERTFMVTADEDELIGKSIQAGRALYTGPLGLFNHPIEEAGYAPFYKWLNDRTAN